METPILNRFFENYMTDKNRRDNTFKAYKYNLNQFYEYFSELLNIYTELDMLKIINNDMLEDYTRWLRNIKGYAQSSVNNKIATIQSYYIYLTESKNILPFNPAKNLPLPLITKEETDVLSHEELTKLISQTYVKGEQQRMFEFNSARDRFVISLTHTTGLRIEELLNAEFEWLDTIEIGYMLNIPESLVKNHKSKRVPIVGKTLQYYNEYIEERNKLKNIKEENIIVLSCRGRKYKLQNYNESLDILIDKIGLDKHITSHAGRHYFATQCKEKRIDANLINRIGGWKIEGIMENTYCCDKNMDKQKIEVCKSLL